MKILGRVRIWLPSVALLVLSPYLGGVAGSAANAGLQWLEHRRVFAKAHLTPFGLAGEPWTSIAIIAAIAVILIWLLRLSWQRSTPGRLVAALGVLLFTASAVYGWRTFSLM